MATTMTDPFPLRWPPGWPREQSPRQSTFRVSSFARTRDGVLAEIARLGGEHAVITSDLPTRRDGLPYASSGEPFDPGVAVWWIGKDGREQCIACDRWLRTRDNLHSIELSIAALRGLERWGSSEIVRRAFAGFIALPPAPGEPDWRAVLGPWVTTLDEARARYRELARQVHPDHGGSTADMQRLVAAYQSAEAELGP